MVQRVTLDQETQIANVGDPTLAQDAATKNYVDTRPGGSSVSVNGTAVTNPNFQSNPTDLGTDLVVTGSNIAGNVRRADVVGVADAEIGLLIGAPANVRIEVSGGSAATTLIINNFANPATMDVTVSGSLSATALANALNAAGRTTIAATQIGGATLTVANYTAPGLANNQVQCNFPAGTTPAQVNAIFGGLRSDAVWAGIATAGAFQFTTNNGSPRRAIPALFAAGANVTLTRDVATDITTIASTGGSGGGTLQQLSDVAIVEPVFAQVGTATVVSISAGTTSIVVTSAAGISVGDWLRGGTVMPGQVPALQVISIAGTLLEFNLDPTPFFAVGNFIYRLPENLEGARLSFSNAQNKWISSASLNFLPMDTISWVSLAGDPYLSAPGSPIVVAPITTNVSNLASPWTFGIATLGTFPSPSEVCGTDALGRQVTGLYRSAVDSGTSTATLEAIKFDRVSGGSFVINNTYPLTWRAGTFALPDYVRFNTTTNAITQGQAAVDGRIATNIGTNAIPGTSTYTNAGVNSPASYGLGGTTWTVNTAVSYAAAVAAMTAAGATPPAVQPGTWTLPTWPIYLSNIAAPTTLQFGTISSIQTNPTNNVLVITFSGNILYFGNQSGGQPLFYLIGKFTFVTPPQTEIIRLAGANSVTSVNTAQGALTLSGGVDIGVVTDVANRSLVLNYTGPGSGVSSSNWTSFSNDQFPTPIGFVATSVGTGYANELYIGMGWNTDTEVLDGGFLNQIKYIGTNQAAPTTPGNGLIFFVAQTYTDLEVIVNTGAWSCSFTTSGASAAANFVVEGVIFARKTANAANPPILSAQIFPGFQGNGSDDMRLVPILSPTYTITSNSSTSFNIVATAGQYSGIINNYAHSDTTNDYIVWFRVYNNAAADNINGFSNLSLTSIGGVRALVSIASAGSVPSLQQVTNVGNTTTTSVSVGNAFQVGFTSPAASNLILLTGSGVGGVPTISTTGVDTNIGLRLTTKGAAPIYIADEIRIGDSATDYLSIVQGSISRSTSNSITIGNTGANTGFTFVGGLSIYSTLQAAGVGTDISVALQPKGTGNVFPIGTTLSASIQPKLAVADGVGSNTLGTGSSGQVLTSGGTTSPYWGAASGGTLAWDIYSVASRYNTAFTPVPNVTATFTVPAMSVVGAVHQYFRYNATGGQSILYRFVPTTDSALSTLSFDSWWGSFISNTTLSGLIVQRGNY